MENVSYSSGKVPAEGVAWWRALPSTPSTALHACLVCGRHPSTHLFAGEDRCGMCGLGDEREDV